MKGRVHMARRTHSDSNEWYEWICSVSSVRYGHFDRADEEDLFATTDPDKVTCKHCLRKLPDYLKEQLLR